MSESKNNLRETARLILESKGLSKDQVEELEQLLLSFPDNVQTRIKLIGYYHRHEIDDVFVRKMMAKHVLWIIENRPDSKIAGLPITSLHPDYHGDLYFEGKRLWMKQVKAFPNNTSVIDNAAAYMIHVDKLLAQKLWEQLEKHEPKNPKWKHRLDLLSELYRIAQAG